MGCNLEGQSVFPRQEQAAELGEACKLKNWAELVSLPLFVGSAPRLLLGWGFQVEIEGNAWVGEHPQKRGSSVRTASVLGMSTWYCVKGASGIGGCWVPRAEGSQGIFWQLLPQQSPFKFQASRFHGLFSALILVLLPWGEGSCKQVKHRQGW